MKLRVWAGNAGPKGLSTIVAATSQRRAVEVLNKHLTKRFQISTYEFKGWWKVVPSTRWHEMQLKAADREGVWQLQRSGKWKAAA